MPEPQFNACSYIRYPCNYQNMVRGPETKVADKHWYSGYRMLIGAKLYVGVLAKGESDKWWETQKPSGKLGPFFTTAIKRAETFNGSILEYSVKTEIELVYTGRQGGMELQEDVFKMGYKGYFSCKECEVSVQNQYVDAFIDWQNVKDITSIVRS